MAMEIKHLQTGPVMEVTGKAIDEISRLRAENAELKGDIKDLYKCRAMAEKFK